MRIYQKIKRMLDLLFSSAVLIMLLPFMAAIILLIRIDSKGSAVFRQQRLGKNGKAFCMYKFRTMYEDTERTGTGIYSFEDDPRVTGIGRFLRRYSIDELPQLVNILKRDMSFIGPRPTLADHPCRYEDYPGIGRKRFDVLPGMTGLAQISGRKAIDWDERIRLDVRYVESLSFKLDMKIFFKTILKVIMKADNMNKNITGFKRSS